MHRFKILMNFVKILILNAYKKNLPMRILDIYWFYDNLWEMLYWIFKLFASTEKNLSTFLEHVLVFNQANQSIFHRYSKNKKTKSKIVDAFEKGCEILNYYNLNEIFHQKPPSLWKIIILTFLDITNTYT